MFNKVILVGNITKDIELKVTQNGLSVTTFSVAVNEGSGEKQRVNFFNVSAWRHTAEFIARWFKKGDPILICGKLNNRSWTDNQGNKRSITEVVVDEASFVARRESRPANAYPPAGNEQGAFTPPPEEAPAYGNMGGFEDLSNDDELPF